ncbi:MAG: exodeoxyribonuclease VII small subunit [Bacteroidota bacterium]
MAKKMKYREALGELENITSAIENEELDVDELTEKVKRASYLLKFCREKLRSTEIEVDNILHDMNIENDTESEFDNEEELF